MPTKPANSRTRRSEVITLDLATKIAKKRGLTIALLKDARGTVCGIPADAGYVDLIIQSADDGSSQFALFGSKVDIDFIKASV